MKQSEIKRLMIELKNEDWMVQFGHCDESGKSVEAGVGVMWRENYTTISPEQISDEELQTTKEQGRVGKYIMDVGRHTNYTVYPIYGKKLRIQRSSSDDGGHCASRKAGDEDG